MAEATNIFMLAAAVGYFYLLVCFLAASPPLIMIAAIIYLATTNNMLIQVTMHIFDESLNDDGNNTLRGGGLYANETGEK